MKKPIDRITEAYYNQMGENFGKKVRERIHWICSNAKGEEILDIGCSQGITSILLGRECKKVLGIDLLEESIESANKLLNDESEITKRYVKFEVANFMDLDFKEAKFDTIIISEVLEHLTDPVRFIKKSRKLLKENGNLIITVPFGVNDYFDHKKTYYMSDIFKEVKNCYKINQIEFLGKWTGVVCSNKNNESFNEIDLELIKKLEDNFYNVEQELLREVRKTKKKAVDFNNELKKNISITEEYKNELKEKDNIISSLKEVELEKEKEILNRENVIQELKHDIGNRENVIQGLKLEIENRGKVISSMKEQELEMNQILESKSREKQLIDLELNEANKLLEEKNKQIIDIQMKTEKDYKLHKKLEENEDKRYEEKKEKLSYQEELLQHIESEEELLIKYKKVFKENQKLKKDLNILNRKYTALSSSKLGSLTIKYWRFKNK